MLPKHPFPLTMVRNLFTLSLVKFGYSGVVTVSDPRCRNTSIYTQGRIWTVLTDRDRALLDSTVQIAQHQHHLMTMIDSRVAINGQPSYWLVAHSVPSIILFAFHDPSSFGNPVSYS